MKRRFPALLIVLVMFSVSTSQAAEKPVSQVERVIIISVDGLRPDLLLRANMPRMRKLLDEGSFSMWARTAPVSITLPSHVSMLTGVTPEVHGITWNGDMPFSRPVYPNVPTLFELAKRAGYTTAMSVAKKKMDALDKPGTIDWKYLAPDSGGADDAVIDHAIGMLREHQPGVMFLHLAEVDNTGHGVGCGTPQQIKAIERSDARVGRIIDAIAELNLADSTLLIISADHGGAGRTHGPEDPKSRTIPWIITGPGIRKGFDLTRLDREFNIDTYDTFATSCAMLGINPHPRNRGKFISQILENLELVKPMPGPTTEPGATTQPSR